MSSTPARIAIEVTESDLFAVLTEIYTQKYTGSYTVHCIDGVPKRVEFPGRQVKLCAAGPVRLDKSPSLG